MAGTVRYLSVGLPRVSRFRLKSLLTATATQLTVYRYNTLKKQIDEETNSNFDFGISTIDFL